MSPEATSVDSNMRDALNIINAGITRYLNTTKDLGAIPQSCGTEVLVAPGTNWHSGNDWWSTGEDLYK